MSTLAAEPVTHSMLRSIVNPNVVLHDVDWHAYEAIGVALRDRPNLQITYDQGTLEIMTLSYQHERIKSLLARLIIELSNELEIRTVAGGSTTYKKEAMAKGLEPDECYYIENADRMRGRISIDLERDPPPDFVIEVDVANRSIRRLPIYAKLGVPELWRWDNWNFRSMILSDGGEYVEYPTSSLFLPNFDLSELLPFIKIGLDEDDFTMGRQFRAWLKQYLADRGLAS